jgi:E3 ubiquitin-protein ligase DOA10
MKSNAIVPMAAQCRFCLDYGETHNNRLIEPCLCKGSARYVHTLCLRRWALIGPDDSAIKCGVCGSAFTVVVLPEKEDIPIPDTLTLRLLDNTMFAGISVQYVVMICSSPHHMITNVKQAQTLFQLLYFACFIYNRRIKNIHLYRSALFKTSIPVLSFLIIIMSFRSTFYNQIILCAGINAGLGMFWKEHLNALREVNRHIT